MRLASYFYIKKFTNSFITLFLYFCYVWFVALRWSCSREELDLVENAHLICLTNDLCEAQCYTGYIFPTGYTMTNFSCHDGQWTPRTFSCKRMTNFLDIFDTYFRLLWYDIPYIWSAMQIIWRVSYFESAFISALDLSDSMVLLCAILCFTTQYNEK